MDCCREPKNTIVSGQLGHARRFQAAAEREAHTRVSRARIVLQRWLWCIRAMTKASDGRDDDDEVDSSNSVATRLMTDWGRRNQDRTEPPVSSTLSPVPTQAGCFLMPNSKKITSMECDAAAISKQQAPWVDILAALCRLPSLIASGRECSKAPTISIPKQLLCCDGFSGESTRTRELVLGFSGDHENDPVGERKHPQTTRRAPRKAEKKKSNNRKWESDTSKEKRSEREVKCCHLQMPHGVNKLICCCKFLHTTGEFAHKVTTHQSKHVRQNRCSKFKMPLKGYRA